MESVSIISITLRYIYRQDIIGQLPAWHGKALRACLHVRHLLVLKLLMYDNLARCIITLRGIIYLTAVLILPSDW